MSVCGTDGVAEQASPLRPREARDRAVVVARRVAQSDVPLPARLENIGDAAAAPDIEAGSERRTRPAVDAPRRKIVLRVEPAADAAPAASVDDARAPYANIGRLVCLLTAASTLGALIWLADYLIWAR